MICANFQLKRTTLTFLAQTCPKMKLGFEIQKTNVGIRISILEIPCAPIFRQNGQLWIFQPRFAQKINWGSNIPKSKSGFGISILEILGAPFFRKNKQLWVFGPKFSQKWILGSKFQKSKSGFEINTSNVPCVPIFSQNGELLIFDLNLRKLANYVQCFSSNIVEGVAERWVEAEMSWWGWIELGGAGCTV